jgi:hypothetical protein
MRNPYAMKLCAEYAVASELTIRGYSVDLFTKGAHPGDLIVTSPRGKTFMIDVKGTRPKPDGSKAHWWPLTPKTYRIGSMPLFYVFVYRDNLSMVFQIMRKATAERRVKGQNPPCLYGFWDDSLNNWRLLPP